MIKVDILSISFCKKEIIFLYLQKQNTSPLQVSKKRAPIRSLTMGALTTQKLN